MRLELGSPDGLGLDSPIVVGYHPVTLARDTTGEADALYAALAALTEQGRQLLFCFPNSDAGSRRLIERAAAFCDASSRSRLYVNLDTPTYWALLRESALLLGNSSSGNHGGGFAGAAGGERWRATARPRACRERD